jgi:Fe2+ or Zn2+ uptake regulation protein
MSSKREFGCKKCGGVVTVEVHDGSSQVEYRLQGGEFKENHGEITVNCKKCYRPVAVISLKQV